MDGCVFPGRECALGHKYWVLLMQNLTEISEILDIKLDMSLGAQRQVLEWIYLYQITEYALQPKKKKKISPFSKIRLS